MRGKFIVLEGGEGSGKSSASIFLDGLLESRGIPHLMTREPGGTALGEDIRSLVLGKYPDKSVRTELLLFYAARAEHVNKVIRPVLESGTHVICDRFDLSTYAYQVGGRARPEFADFCRQTNHFATAGLIPDHYLVFDVDVEEGLRRAKGRGDGITNFERETIAFHERVREAFRGLAVEYTGKCSVVNANDPHGRVLENVERTILSILGEKIAA